MIGPVTSPRPLELLRASSEQIRRAADLLAEISDETDPERRVRLAAARVAAGSAEEVEEGRAERLRTIEQAQRSFVASLRLEQLEERPDRH